MFEVELNSDRRQDPGLQHYLHAIGKHRLLTKQQEYALARRIRAGDREALDRLVNANLRFVVSVAKKFLNRGLSYMDLIAEGNIGLITAARRFDERRDFRFISYAVWWIRQSIQKALADQINTVRLPMNRALQVQRAKVLRRKLEQQHRRQVQDEEIAEALELGEKKLVAIQQAASPTLSLDEGLGEDEGTLAEILVDPEAVTPEEGFVADELRRELGEALAQLDPRERLIVVRYFGLGDHEVSSLDAIGKDIKLSRERVRQIRNQALAKIRRAPRGELLLDYLN